MREYFESPEGLDPREKRARRLAATHGDFNERFAKACWSGPEGLAPLRRQSVRSLLLWNLGSFLALGSFVFVIWLASQTTWWVLGGLWISLFLFQETVVWGKVHRLRLDTIDSELARRGWGSVESSQSPSR
jgi:hypothetical protein